MITFDQLIFALAIVESSLNPLAVGDNGNAVGYLQITPAVVQDVNTFYGTTYHMDDRYDTRKSVEICKKYLKYWGEVFEKKTGRPPSAEIYAKMWNGGCYAWKKTDPKVVKNLDIYWEKVNKQLDNIDK
jgi:hypothetical protein